MEVTCRWPTVNLTNNLRIVRAEFTRFADERLKKFF